MKAKQYIMMSLALLMAIGMVTTGSAQAVRTEIPVSITTPDKVEAKIGTLQFKDGYPTGEAAAKIRDELDSWRFGLRHAQGLDGHRCQRQ